MEGLKIYIVGFPASGINGVSKETKDILEDCDLIFASKRFYNILADYEKIKNKLIQFPESLGELPDKISRFSNKKICVLATGDPDFYGITNFLNERFPDKIEKVIPSVSIMQEAFARLKKSWEDAGFLSIHGRNKSKLLPFLLKNKKGFVFTSDSTDVLFMLNLLKKYRLTDYKIHIFEDLGLESEKVSTFTYPYLLKGHISNLNVLIFERDNFVSEYLGLGLNDEEFFQKKGMITKKEIRVNVLAQLDLKEGLVFWDVGAGTGSVSIEACYNPVGVIVYAIEKDEASYLNMKRNIEKFSAFNVIPFLSDFKDIAENLPEPDRIFIGGSGGEILETINLAYKFLKNNGIMVVSAVSINTFNKVINFCEQNNIGYEVTGIVSIRTKKTGKNLLFNSQNPVFLIRMVK